MERFFADRYRALAVTASILSRDLDGGAPIVWDQVDRAVRELAAELSATANLHAAYLEQQSPRAKSLTSLSKELQRPTEQLRAEVVTTPTAVTKPRKKRASAKASTGNRRARRTFTDEFKAEVRAAKRDGATWKELFKRFDLGASTLSKILNEGNGKLNKAARRDLIAGRASSTK